ncbi:MAG: hypothetical protein AAFQ01_01295 [Bacteroidota bacterium]
MLRKFFQKKQLASQLFSLKRTSTSLQASSTEYFEVGLTLIECLVAIAVIASTIGVIAPVTILAVATRVQNQRAEQAIHIAQSELNRVRLTVERGGNFTLSNIPSTTGTLDSVPPPENLDSVAASTSTNAARPVDVNDDGRNDYAVQLFRTYNPTGMVESTPVAFELGVRVYKARTIQEFTSTQLTTDQAALTLTSGEGKGYTRPLAVLYTTIVKSDRPDSLCDYYRYTNDAHNSTPFVASTTTACQ